MAGLMDLFGGGGGGMFGDLLTPQQQQALAQRSLLGFLGGMQKSGALDYTAPFISGKVPAGFAAGLAGGMAGMGEAQDTGALTALKATQLGQEAANLKSQTAAREAMMKEVGELGPALQQFLAGGGGGAPVASAPAAPASLGVGGALTAGSSGRGGWGQLAAPAVETLSGAGLSPAAVQGIMANGLGEGGFKEPWVKAGGGENSFGHWQFNQRGELPGYLAWAQGKGDPQNTKLQAQFVAHRMEELVPGFSKITDPKQATDLVALKFERYKGAAPGQRYGYLADVQKAMSGGEVAPRAPIPPAPGQLPEGMLPAVPNFAGAFAGNQGAAYAPSAPVASDAPIRLTAQDVVLRDNNPKTQKLADGSLVSEDAFPYPYVTPTAASAGQPGVAPVQAPQQPVAPPGMPQAPPADPKAAFAQALMLKLAQQNARAEMLKMGNPFGSMISVLQNSPQFQAAVEQSKRAAGLQFVGPEATARQNATNQSDLQYKPKIEGLTEEAKNLPLAARAEFQALLDRETKAREQGRAAQLDMTTITVPGPGGVPREIPVTRDQAVRAAQGMGVPELGLSPTVPQQPSAAGAAPGAAQPQGGGLLPGGAMLGKPVGIGSIPPSQQLVDTPEGPKLVNIPGGAEARAAETQAQAKRQSTDIVTQDIGRAQKLLGFWTTGTLGSFLQAAPGTPAHDLNQVLQGLKANAGFGQLQEMRNASPTGGALGNVTETENKLLQSTLGSLEQSQNQEQLDFNLRRLHNVYLDIVHGSPEKLNEAVKAGKMTPAQRDATLANRYDLSGQQPSADSLPRGVPPGAEQIGTYQGKPVYKMPDGSRKVLQ